MAYRDQEYVENLHPRLKEICTLLEEVDMTEDDCDLIACSFCHLSLKRCVYVFLDLNNTDKCEIGYDFEDYKSGSKEWDMAIEKGIIENTNDFRNRVYAFLLNDT